MSMSDVRVACCSESKLTIEVKAGRQACHSRRTHKYAYVCRSAILVQGNRSDAFSGGLQLTRVRNLAPPPIQAIRIV